MEEKANSIFTFHVATIIRQQKINLYLWLCLLAICMAELIIGLGYTESGVLLHLAILLGLYFFSAYYYQNNINRLYLALSLVPLVRIVDLAVPPFPRDLVFTYGLTGVPLFVAVCLVARENGISLKKIAFERGRLIQVISGYCLGVVIGCTNYLLLRPEPLNQIYGNLPRLIIFSLFLTGSSVLEELLFRGVLYHSAIKITSPQVGWLWSSFVYSSLQLCRLSILHTMSALAAALILTNLVRHNKSLVSVSMAHAVANLVFFLVAPLLF